MSISDGVWYGFLTIFGAWIAALLIFSFKIEFLFWVVVGLWLWYAGAEFKHGLNLRAIQNRNNVEMETL